jgi:hypothetical protein
MNNSIDQLISSKVGNSFSINRLNQNQERRQFQNILDETNNSSQKIDKDLAEVPGSRITDPGLEKLRLELVDRLNSVNSLPDGTKSLNDLYPRLLESRSRFKLLNEAMSNLRSTAPNKVDLQGRFGQVEREWFDLERVMLSDRELSSGELLGLQARLYQVSQHIEMLSKVVDQMTSGVKTVLNTNV